MSKDPKERPPPAKTDLGFIFSSAMIGALIIFMVVMAYYSALGQEHLEELETRSYANPSSAAGSPSHPDYSAHDPAQAAIIDLSIPNFGRLTSTTAKDTDPPDRQSTVSPEDTSTPHPETPAFDYKRCDKWTQETRFECERHPDMPEECCLGC